MRCGAASNAQYSTVTVLSFGAADFVLRMPTLAMNMLGKPIMYFVTGNGSK